MSKNLLNKKPNLERLIHSIDMLSQEICSLRKSNEQSNALNSRKNLTQSMQENVKIKEYKIKELQQQLVKEQQMNGDNLNKLNEDISSKNNEIKELKEDISSKNNEIQNLKDKINSKDEEDINNNNNEIQGLKEDINSRNIRIKELREHINDKDNKVKELQLDINSKERTINELEESLNYKDNETKELQLDINSKERTINELEESVNYKDNETKELQLDINSKERTINELEESVNYKDNETKGLQLDINNKNNEIQQLNDNIKSKYNEVQALKADISSKNSEVEVLKNNVETQNRDIEKYTEKIKMNTEKFGTFDDVVYPYVQIAKKTLSCDSTKKLIESYEPINNTENIIKFISYFGSEYQYATNLYNALKSTKIQTKEPLNEKEIDLIQSLNEFYKSSKEIDFDILLIPSSSDSKRFQKLNHTDLEKPATTSFKYYSDIYVPQVMKNEKTTLFRALIKGTN